MGRKRSLQQIQQLDYLNIGEVHTLTGVRQSTLKYYCEIGILPFTQSGSGLNRKFPRIETLERLDQIADLKKRHFTIENIVDFFKKKDAKVKIETKVKSLTN